MIILLLTLLFFFNCYLLNAAPPFGQLSVNGSKLLGSNSQQVQLAGMSLFWSNCGEGSIFYNAETLKALKCSWNANTVRAAMGVESTGCQRPGYLDVPLTERDKVEAVVKAAIQLDMYVVIDWHDNNAPNHLDKAIEFFTYFAQNYGKHPHILYETFNEPLQVDWSGVKAYHEKVVAAIRKYDTKNVIILGTTTWSQDVDIASSNPVNGANLCYTLHIYADSHRQNIRDKAQAAINKGACIFVTEYGTDDVSGGGPPNKESMEEWYAFWDKNKISYLNWAIDNKGEGSCALLPETVATLVGNDDRLTASGRIVKAKLKSMNTGVSCNGVKSGGGDSALNKTSEITKPMEVKTTTVTPTKPKNGYPVPNNGKPNVPVPNNGKPPAPNNGKPVNGYPAKNPVNPAPVPNNGTVKRDIEYPASSTVKPTVQEKPKNGNGGYPVPIISPNNPATIVPPPKNNNNNGGSNYPVPNSPSGSATTEQPDDDEDDDDDDDCVCENEDLNNGNDDNSSPVTIQSPVTGSSPNNAINNGSSGNVNNGPSSVSLTCEKQSDWSNGANFILDFKNNGNSKACAVKFSLTLAPGQKIQSIWNCQKVSENIYVLPDHVIIQAGDKNCNSGLTVSGPASIPQVNVLGQGQC